ncbi:hypothetical protein [Bergeyella zoohelcum]|uniref:Uncharacterized protein n=1 Tax=Bergeyella zoohelcum TaxID=1015 RepID=A0A376BZ75_9FLAO|nr:hypothetical protein [Bergeyella zoohelcum]EKB60957.1 hypothetical protein HMPREF9700_00452 [Bergeyella zoohelcum CCUG 30536]SSZ46952.1 Uncharacterised protein [Bergeyella zoohelcum]
MTKVENLSDMYRICERKKMKGDNIVLSRILGISQSAAFFRYKRGVPQAVKIMYNIIMAREELIERYTKEVEEENLQKEKERVFVV